ncbi:hypothetical protein [Methylobacterium trifolii]|uniref:Uncharacterized protein n=1 Tax=Methylobacterium trifolii TaxID=1003092 RepID=A0ABQ4TSA8_9HYPH|nr:hypothetical protein [Methylobacterium trifolii]GJE58228.1 hypothetical protein MPOCJGCO_0307 [Methylobacterium trifolii]
MLPLASLLDELERNLPARAAMTLLERSLSRRTVEEQTAFWRAIDLYYVSRKAPGEADPQPAPVGPATDAAIPAVA